MENTDGRSRPSGFKLAALALAAIFLILLSTVPPRRQSLFLKVEVSTQHHQEDKIKNDLYELLLKIEKQKTTGLPSSKTYSALTTTTYWDSLQQYACNQQCETGTSDVIVVGGGVSGLYAAWRLKSSSPAMKVRLLETSTRFGGRLFSVILPGMPHLAADLGGMHYADNPNETLNAWLVDKHFSMPSRIFLENATDPHVPTYLRGSHITQDMLSNNTFMADLYHLSPSDRELLNSAGDARKLTTYLLRKEIPDVDDPHFNAWSAKTASGMILNQLSSGNLFRFSGASHELLSLISDLSGYGSSAFASDSNAANFVHMVQHYSHYSSVSFRVPLGGMQALPNELLKRFVGFGGDAQTSHTVKGVFRCPSQTTFYQSLLVDTDDGQKNFCAHHVILALTRNALDDLLWLPLLQKPVTQFVFADTANKLYLGFDRPFWRETPFVFREGSTTTTLDLRHLLYIGTEEDFQNQIPFNVNESLDANVSSLQNRNSLLLASYTTSEESHIWRDLSVNLSSFTPFTGRPNPFVNTSHSSSPHPSMPGVGRQITTQMVSMAMKQLAQLHNVDVSALPEPYTAIAYDWPKSWHHWLAGANATEIIAQALRLSEENNVYLCGEVFSKDQGWAEGGLRSAEYVMQKIFSLSPLEGMPTEWMKNYAHLPNEDINVSRT